ncbi:MAG: HEAT repeat domain-containing protein [Bdellovibrionia bacterium]
MLKTVLATFLISQAATAATMSDILNLPAPNRTKILQKGSNKHYSQAKSIAFSAEQPMGMRWKALTAMADIKGIDATGDILEASKRKEWFMRNAALLALNEVNPFESKTLALKLLKDPALVVRSASVNVLSRQMDNESRDRLWQELEAEYNYSKGQSLWIRSQILETLAKNPKSNEMALFAKALQDKDERMHEPAIRGLESITKAGIVKDKMDRKKAVSMWQEYLTKTN